MINKFLGNLWFGKIFVLVFSILGIVGIYYFEENIVVKIIFIIFTLSGLYFVFYKKNLELSLLANLYLILVTLYGLNEFLHLSLAIILLAYILFSFLTFYLLFSDIEEAKIFGLLLSILISLEIFIALIPWTTFLRTKAMIILAIIYVLWGIWNLKWKNELTLAKIAPYCIIGLVFIILAITTSIWYAY